MSDGRKYYCFCDSNCKYETMTKEQILAAIAQAIATGTVGECDTGFITKVKETNGGSCITFWVGTQAEYNALATKEKNCVYIISDDTFIKDMTILVERLQDAAESAEVVAAEALKRATNIITPSMDDGMSYRYIYDEDALNDWLSAQLGTLKQFPAVNVTGIYAEDIFGTDCFITVKISIGMESEGAVATFEAAIDGCVTRWQKTLHENEWTPLEWENPPMKTGVTYRTTERHNGKPVYAKTMSVELGEDGVKKSLLFNSGVTKDVQIVRVDAVCKPISNLYPWTTFPLLNQSDRSVAATCDIKVEEIDNEHCELFAEIRTYVSMVGDIATVTMRWTR
jgi:hypothetical protein